MSELTKEQKRAELERKIKSMRLMDDNFMTVVLSDKACAELVIRIILDRDDIFVKSTRTQYQISSLKNHSVRLDVYAEDSEGTKYDIEIQRSDRGATPKRARYISSMIDSDALPAGEDYDELPETYVIFITENDILKQNKPLYIIDRTINGTPEKFGDGAHILYVNSRIHNDTKLGKLMKDFSCVDPDGYSYRVLSDRAGYFKNSKEGLQTMCRIVEEIVEKEVAAAKAEGEAIGKAIGKAEGEAIGKAKGEANAKRDSAVRMLKKGQYSIKEIADILDLDPKAVEEISRQLAN